MCIRAVSYTHLDVYKRQDYMCVIHLISNMRYTLRSLISVSYTHLDVYKRQEQS